MCPFHSLLKSGTFGDNKLEIYNFKKVSTFGALKLVHHSEVISSVSFIQSVLYRRCHCIAF